LSLISVIVPVYKVEKYLDRCVQSIVDQTYRNLEIILVDDGSPDNCGAMCDAWAAKDSRIQVIHKANGGGGEARNVALDIARGEFVSLIDSDDYIEPHMYEHLLSLITDEIDIAECGILETEADDAALDDSRCFESAVYDADEAMRLHITDTLFRQTPPNKLYRRSTIGDIRFPVGNRIDDEFWTYRVIANARKLVRSSCNMYAYRQQPGSVMHLSFALPRLQALDAKCQRLELVTQRFPQLVSCAKINLWYTCLYMGQMSMLYMDRTDRREAFQKLKLVRKQHALTKQDTHTLPLKQQIWAVLSWISFPAACRLRNLLHIGI
jgi:glycosyltransferase involved in cell wall biosynthesis